MLGQKFRKDAKAAGSCLSLAKSRVSIVSIVLEWRAFDFGCTFFRVLFCFHVVKLMWNECVRCVSPDRPSRQRCSLHGMSTADLQPTSWTTKRWRHHQGDHPWQFRYRIQIYLSLGSYVSVQTWHDFFVPTQERLANANSDIQQLEHHCADLQERNT